MAILSADERVALIAHEQSHGANGDPLRGEFLNGAVNTLAAWTVAIRPDSIGKLGDGLPFGPFVSLLAIPFELLMLATSELVFSIVKGFLLLVLRESQRAEYLADLLASTVAGTEQMQRALEKTYLGDVVDAALRTHALTVPTEPLGDKLVDAVRALSAVDLDRYRAQSKQLNWRVDSTHPPTAMRIDMLALQAQRAPTHPLSPAEVSELDSEIARLVAANQRELVNRKIAAIYG